MRRPEFRVRTEIVREGAHRLVRKRAEHPDAVPFMEKILEREERAEAFYHPHAEVVRGHRNDDAIEYPYLSFPSLEQEIEGTLVSGDPNSGAHWVQRYLDFLRSLPAFETVPRAFLDRVGAAELSCRCFVAGPVDCIPRNILMDGDRWYVLDHEWMLEVPVPVDWVAYLGISSLIFDLQDAIQRHAGDVGPVGLFAGRFRRFFAPLRWLELLEALSLSLHIMNDWYFRFQQGVVIDASPRVLRRWTAAFTRLPGRLHPAALLSDLETLIGPLRHLFPDKDPR